MSLFVSDHGINKLLFIICLPCTHSMLRFDLIYNKDRYRGAFNKIAHRIDTLKQCYSSQQEVYKY